MNKTNVTLPTDYQNFIALSRYARWLSKENRRENWSETITRYLDYMKAHLIKKYNYYLSDNLYGSISKQITELGVMPSMRALMTSGVALD